MIRFDEYYELITNLAQKDASSCMNEFGNYENFKEVYIANTFFTVWDILDE